MLLAVKQNRKQVDTKILNPVEAENDRYLQIFYLFLLILLSFKITS